jgi:hypothetical protein
MRATFPSQPYSFIELWSSSLCSYLHYIFKWTLRYGYLISCDSFHKIKNGDLQSVHNLNFNNVNSKPHASVRENIFGHISRIFPEVILVKVSRKKMEILIMCSVTLLGFQSKTREQEWTNPQNCNIWKNEKNVVSVCPYILYRGELSHTWFIILKFVYFGILWNIIKTIFISVFLTFHEVWGSTLLLPGLQL